MAATPKSITVALVPVTCKSCKYWEVLTKAGYTRWGLCRLMESSMDLRPGNEARAYSTEETWVGMDFGCNQWEAKASE